MDRPELTLVTHFSSIPDYRENHNKQHILVEILVMAVCGVICGANAFTEIAVIANEKKEWLQTAQARAGNGNRKRSSSLLNFRISGLLPMGLQRARAADRRDE